MRAIQFLALMVATCVFLPSCISTNNQEDLSNEYYNICLVLDGTDRLSEQNGVLCISKNDITEIAKDIANSGTGCLYVSYVDDNCDNNHIAIFEWEARKPVINNTKLDYMQIKEFEDNMREANDKLNAYNVELDNAVLKFGTETETICQSAYSDAVARSRKGSDVNGAINQAIRLLRASERVNTPSYIILISDGCDNVGKQLAELPSSVELIIVNTNVSKHQYCDIISKDYVTMKQALNYIFK